jgi:hypothetical protein
MRPLVVLVEFLVKPSFTAQFRDLVAVNAKASLERKVGCKRSMCSSIQRSQDVSSSTRSTRINWNNAPSSRLAFSSAMATSEDDFT